MPDSESNQDNFQIEQFYTPPQPRSKFRRLAFGFWVSLLVAILVVVGGLLVYKTGFTFNQIQTGEVGELSLTENMATPTPDSDRINILLLGLRGEDDPNGGLLTDSVMVLSVKKSTGQVALISIPRDLFILMPGANYKEKINFAYALGFEKKGAAGALLFSKIAVSQVTGLYIDKAVSVDHAAFKEVIDILGGVDVYLDKPFSEKTQFAKEMLIDLPAGQNHLDGTTALYFVRSRFETSDFDRARRQQLVLVAAKDKALSLGVIANPVKVFQILDSLGRNVKTDMSISDIKSLLTLANGLEADKITHKVFDTTPEGLLQSSKSDAGAYILLPAAGDFSKIQSACRNIFGQ